MTTVAVLVVMVLSEVRVSVLVPVVGLGLKDAVTPLGRPETERLALTTNPAWGVTVIVVVVELERFSIKDDDEELSVNDGEMLVPFRTTA